MVVDERFVLRVPGNLDLAGTAPLLCAGITTWSPMRRQGVSQGKKVGVVGLGGLGHMGVKFARALGAHVVVFTTSSGKKDDALRLGAHEVVVSRNADEMRKHAGSFDFILDTVSAEHDVNAYIHLLRRDGNLTLVGAPDEPHAVSAFGLIFGNKSLSGSLIGGIRQTQEMLDFCGEHGITSDVEVIPIQQVDEAYRRLLVQGTVTTNDPDLMRLLAVSGVGLLYTFEPQIADDLRRGSLRLVLEQYAAAVPGFFLYFPSRAQVSPAFRAFVDVARERATASNRPAR